MHSTLNYLSPAQFAGPAPIFRTLRIQLIHPQSKRWMRGHFSRSLPLRCHFQNYVA